ncbi:MAG: tetratricopeptide repeat protein [Verrucomicrobiota bacterium]|jgi:tetratricopeptide (TPR) repeat protein
MSNGTTEAGNVVADGGGSRWTRCSILGAVCALVIGIYAWSANSGYLESLGSGARDSYYNLLVRGFQDGHLCLKRELPPGVILSRDPRNVSSLQANGLYDLSYYKGRLYLYFGVTPALALFWPYAALTGHYLLEKDAVAIFFSVGFLAGAALLCAVWRRYFKEVGVGVVAAGTLALGLANFAPAILEDSDVYEVAISCGYALTMLALAGIWAALGQPQHRGRWLAAASLAYGLAVGARPSLLFGAVILLVPVVQAWREKRPLGRLLLAAGGPIVAVGLALMAYNALRFDNPLEFGQRFQLPLTPRQQFRLRYIWINFRVGFLEPACWSWRPPFVNDIAAPALPGGYDNVEHVFGVLTNIPLVWLALAAPLAWRRRPGEERSVLRWFVGALALLFGICWLTLSVHDSMFLRYELEYASPLLFLAVIGVLALERALAGQPLWRRAARGCWILPLAFSVVFNLLERSGIELANHTKIGDVLLQRGRAEEAIAQYREALRIKPDYTTAHSNLGNALLQTGRVDEAIAEYQKALQIRPDIPDARNNLGTAFAIEGNLDKALEQYRIVLQIRPDYPGAQRSLGKMLLLKGDLAGALACLDTAATASQDPQTKWYNFGNQFLQERAWPCAIACYGQAIKINPGFADAHANLGVAFSQKGEIQQAMDSWQQALEINPDQVYVQNNLAWLLATTPDASLRNGAKAVALATQANQSGGGANPMVLHTLAAAYAEEGSYALAAVTAQHALELATAQKNDALAAALQKEIQLYEAGAPVRDAPR